MSEATSRNVAVINDIWNKLGALRGYEDAFREVETSWVPASVKTLIANITLRVQEEPSYGSLIGDSFLAQFAKVNDREACKDLVYAVRLVVLRLDNPIIRQIFLTDPFLENLVEFCFATSSKTDQLFTQEKATKGWRLIQEWAKYFEGYPWQDSRDIRRIAEWVENSGVLPISNEPTTKPFTDGTGTIHDRGRRGHFATYQRPTHGHRRHPCHGPPLDANPHHGHHRRRHHCLSYFGERVERELAGPFVNGTNDKADTEPSVVVRAPVVERNNASVHPDVMCDSCSECPIRGTRYKCLECPNFDLCTNCEGKGEHEHHNMIAIRRPQSQKEVRTGLFSHRENDRAGTELSAVAAVPVVKQDNPSVHPDVTCDSCFECPIRGTRYKCLECPNFDLCANCEGNGEHEHHNMTAIRRPQSMIKTTEQDSDHVCLVKFLLDRQSEKLWLEVTRRSDELSRAIWAVVSSPAVSDLIQTRPPTALGAMLSAVRVTQTLENQVAFLRKLIILVKQLAKKTLLEETLLSALLDRHVELKLENDSNAMEVVEHELRGLVRSYSGVLHLLMMERLIAGGFRELAAEVAGQFCKTASTKNNVMQMVELLTEEQPCTDNMSEVWQMIADSFSSAGKIKMAMDIYVKIRYAGKYKVVLPLIENSADFDAWSTAVDYIKMVKQTTNDETVKVSLTKALLKAKKYDELEQHLLGPSSDADDKLCVVCQEEPKTIAFFPCGHLCVCVICTEQVFETCPVCRAQITGKLRVFA